MDKFATFIRQGAKERRLHNFLTNDEYRKKGKATYIIRYNQIIVKGRYSPTQILKVWPTENDF